MIRAAALLLTTLTGFSGLVYEIAWQKYLGILLGSDSEATAAILAIFLGGLAVGYRVFAAATARLAGTQGDARPRLLRLYGVVEGGIGLYILLFPALFRLALRLSLALHHGGGGVGFAIDVGITALLIGPPTVLMGGTIPILTQGLSKSLQDSTRVHALIYASNTAGAFAGAGAAGFLLIPALGLESTITHMGWINLVAGVAFAAMGLRRPTGVAAEAPAVAADAPKLGRFSLYALVAVLAGFAMMTIQTVLIRMGGLALGASQFTFSTVVSIFVLCIALGSMAVSLLPRLHTRWVAISQWLLVAWLLVLYHELEDVGYWALQIRRAFGQDDAAFLRYHVALDGALLAALIVPVGLSGALLPLLFGVLRQRLGDLGAIAGRLYSWNTVGSFFGALLGGYALYFWLDLTHVYRLAVLSLALGALVLTWLLRPRAERLAALAAAGGVATTLWLQPAWRADKLSAGLFRRSVADSLSAGSPSEFADRLARFRDVIFYDDDPVTSVAVVEPPSPGRRPGAPPGARAGDFDAGAALEAFGPSPGDFDAGLAPKTFDPSLWRSILSNGKSDGIVPMEYATTSLLAILPALLADRCERSFVIGWGTGVTVGELAALDCSRRVVVSEISPAVMEAAPLFDAWSRDASRNSKVDIVVGDAYRTLMRSDEKFDLIVSEPPNPWVTGVEMLFSREFLGLARARLTPHGVHAQWFHVYEADTPTIELVLRTYTSVFDRVQVWAGMRNDMILIGFNDAETTPDLARLEQRFAQRDFRRGLERAGVSSLPALLAREVYPLGTLNAERWPGRVHTLLGPILGYSAARALFRGETGSLPGAVGPAARAEGRRNSLLRRYAARQGYDLPDDERRDVVLETCEWGVAPCTTLLAEWQQRRPDSPALAQTRADAARSIAPERVLGPIDELVDLFDPDGRAEGTTREIALRQSELFAYYYHHAAPFERRALVRAWRGCLAGGDRDRCEQTLGAVEAKLGPLRESGAP